MTSYDLLLLPENLSYAWSKAKALYRATDGYINYAELAEFELDLEQRLLAIQKQFERGSYRLNKLRPLPRPKKIDDGRPIDRQYYHVSVDDQVAWIAIANVLGPQLDKQTPPWNYGNRIYRPAWYEKGEGRRSTLEIGPYRHASGHLYRKFQHSWPLFRRHVALTARTMAKARTLASEELDDADNLAQATATKEGLAYLHGPFWQPKQDGSASKELYHASIDLKQFYPSLKKEAILAGLNVAGAADDTRMRRLLDDMLAFKLDPSEMPHEMLDGVEPKFNRSRVQGIPTGLFVAGFLANATMLPIDIAVDQRIREKRSVAHFRFVDDHTILAYNFEELCDWIDSYRTLLVEHGTGATVNSKKYDPDSLSEWMRVRAKPSQSKSHSEKKEEAVRDTRLDGANPIKLLTKTLAQVSAIAATNIDVLDDEDLQERLKQLEWLLLADIPEREIRPDTRAAFAAGQIAMLAPTLLQEVDGLVDAARDLAAYRAKAPDQSRATTAEVEEYNTSLAEKIGRVKELEAQHEKREGHHLQRCFALLLQAFREFPGKARLFFRLHEYCRVTGFNGLTDIAEWIRDAHKKGQGVWAHYYAGLSLQILSRGALSATRILCRSDVLRSDIVAALEHLESIACLDDQAFLIHRDSEAWFHAVGRRELGVALLAAAEVVDEVMSDKILAARLSDLSRKCIAVTFDQTATHWKSETAFRPSVWAHLCESVLSFDGLPSASWFRFKQLFSLSEPQDFHAGRRYPTQVSDNNWTQLLESDDPLPESDSGWLREVMVGSDERIHEARTSRRLAFNRAARSLEPAPTGWITLEDWTDAVAGQFTHFDPRRSEWTALEIVRQVASQLKEIEVDQSAYDRLHPNNVLIPAVWKTGPTLEGGIAEPSWEQWRLFLSNDKAPRLRDSATSILDYRYFADQQTGQPLDGWELQLAAIGRLLLGTLRLDHGAPRIWNIRGNERVFPLPRAAWFQTLAISSRTLLLIEGCLGGRSAETRAISRKPKLFGWEDGLSANDADFDPPLLRDPDELLKAIQRAQELLGRNQLAVAMNRPRQLIPFRLMDFATGPDAVTDEEEALDQ